MPPGSRTLASIPTSSCSTGCTKRGATWSCRCRGTSKAGTRGTFALRSPVRPNPIALAVVELLAVEGATLTVRKVDCIDGTPLLDIKPYYASIDSVPGARRP